MKVYVVYEKDGYGGAQIACIFKHREDARIYVTTDYMINNTKNADELMKMQDECIDEFEVIEEL